MAIFVGRKKLVWVAEAAHNLENRLKSGFEAREHKGACFIVAKDECEPREALSQINAASASLPGASSDYARPLYVWCDGSEPVPIAEAYVRVLDAMMGDDWAPTHPMSASMAPPSRD